MGSLAAACEPLVETCGILTRDGTQVPCIGSTVSQPLDHQRRSQHPHSLITPSLRPGFPGGSDGKESACNAGDECLIPGSGICPGEGNGNLLQYSCLENPMDRGAWQAAVHGVAKSQTRLRD